jgi:5-amino-6-(5-phosphoribosylamino)uracil reductase/diaminohydroxyphosphoribosylaminopyrimidine deaminase/5-amino-6-(5-phosphoribosylamino)uracil reductase
MARPLVTLHFAQSLDGRIGLGPGRERALLSSEEGLACAHRARAEHDAVLVGIETLLSDDPLLTARAAGARQPLRVVLDSSLRLPLDARLLAPESAAGQVLVFGCAERASNAQRGLLERRGAAVQLTRSDAAGRVALGEVLDVLGERGVRRVLVEGGATVITAFLLARLATRAEVEVSPVLLGAPATPALRELGIERLGTALRLDRLEVQRLGPSVLLCGDIVYPAGGAC